MRGKLVCCIFKAWEKLVMHWFLVEYRGIATCHLYFLPIHTRLKAGMNTESTSDALHIPRYPTRNHCITTMYRSLISHSFVPQKSILTSILAFHRKTNKFCYSLVFICHFSEQRHQMMHFNELCRLHNVHLLL